MILGSAHHHQQQQLRLAKSRIGVHSRSVLPLTEKVQKVSPLTREILYQLFEALEGIAG